VIEALLLLTDRGACAGPLPDTVAAAVGFGARAVVLREKDLPAPERSRLAAQLREILDPVGGRLIVAGPASSHGAGPGGSGAVHLAARDPFPSPRPELVGRSCHDPAEVAAAAAQGCDYVTLSPIFLTASKPGYGPALGTGALASMIRALVASSSARRRDRPAPAVYALGGVLPADVPACLAAGARGVAVMGPVMREPRLVVEYLARLSAVPPEVSA
jgi:thiamine monophosphate synthase